MMPSPRRLAPFFVAVFSLLLWCGQPGAAVAATATAQPSADQIRLTKLVADESTSNGSSGPVQLDATLTYQIQSVPRAFVLLFLFKDNATTATESTATREWVTSGTGPLHLSTSFQPETGLHTWTLVAGVFKDDQTLLAWTATQPFTLGQWPGRGDFDKALADRRSGNYAQAVDDLTAAIQAAPQTGQYYCWRADNRVRLGQYSQAVADYRQAVQLMPSDRACRVGLGVALLWDGQQPDAISVLTGVITQSQNADRWTVFALRARGIAYADLSQFSDAVADYQSYLKLAPKASDQALIENWIVDLHSAESQDASSANAG